MRRKLIFLTSFHSSLIVFIKQRRIKHALQLTDVICLRYLRYRVKFETEGWRKGVGGVLGYMSRRKSIRSVRISTFNHACRDGLAHFPSPLKGQSASVINFQASHTMRLAYINYANRLKMHTVVVRKINISFKPVFKRDWLNGRLEKVEKVFP